MSKRTTYPHSAVIQLKPTVNFPTRGANILDQVFTNLKNYYTQPVRGPPFGLSDHVTITIFPETRSRTESQRKLIKVRDKRQSKVASLGRYLINIPWEDLLSSDQTVDEKLELFTELIHYGLDTIMPERSLKVCVNDRPWMTSQLKRLIIQRQKAFATDNMQVLT